ncbi:MAG: hypothetical protein PHR00_02045 [Patescibacteria group bacterium]|nr:hypothetical protein [Patescibacteria group bacterium]
MVFNQNLAKNTIHKLIQEAKRLKALEISIDFKLKKVGIKNQSGSIISSFELPEMLINSLKKEFKAKPDYLSSYKIIPFNTKTKIILKPETKVSLTALSENNDLSELYNTLIKRSGIIIVSSAQENLKKNLAKAILEAFDNDSHNIINISNEIGPELKRGLITGIKNLDADIIQLETELPADDILPLADLADKKLIIISILADNIWNGLKPLTKTTSGKNFLNKINLAIHAKEIPLICVDCRDTYPLNELLKEEAEAKLGLSKDVLAKQIFYYGSGCQRCNHTGEKDSLILIESANLSDINYQNEKDWRQYFANPLHNTWLEQAFNLTLAGKISLEKLLLEL